MAAVELGVAVPTIAAAVDARVLSAQKSLRVSGEELLGRRSADLVGIDEQAISNALWAAKVASYAQGMQLLEAASIARGYDSDLAVIPQIWTAGCIIRARFLSEIAEAFSERHPELLAFDEAFASKLAERRHDLARTVSAAITAGLPVPGLSASLAWIDTLTTGRGSASLIQAQRDSFGSHTYRRLDDPETAVHTNWP
jgi:6-phosphogluconate dehydrogenase